MCARSDDQREREHWQSGAPTAIVPCQLRHGGTAHNSPCVAIAQVNKPVKLVAMLVEEPLPSRVNPSGRLDFLLRAHPPSLSPLRHNHSSAQALRCRKHCGKHANLQSGDTDEAARSDWYHEGSRAGADEYAQLNIKHQMTAASEVDYLLYYQLYGKARKYKFEVYCSLCGKMTPPQRV